MIFPPFTAILLFFAFFGHAFGEGNEEQHRVKADKAMKLLQVVGNDFEQLFKFYQKHPVKAEDIKYFYASTLYNAPINAPINALKTWKKLNAPINALHTLFNKFTDERLEGKLHNLEIKITADEEREKWDKRMALFQAFVTDIHGEIVEKMTRVELLDFSAVKEANLKNQLGEKINQMTKQKLEEEFKAAVMKLKNSGPDNTLTKLTDIAYEVRALGLALDKTYGKTVVRRTPVMKLTKNKQY
jgi:hypothetical protein